MGLVISLIIVAVLLAIGYAGGSVEGLNFIFAVVLPYIAIVTFLVGLVIRIIGWAKSPVPFRITTTCGQQKSLDFIRQNKLDSPFTGWQTFLRMALEILTFRSLFRNTDAGLKDGPKLTYGASKWLWLFSLAFHYSFLVIVLRHFRFFVEPVPSFVYLIQELDGFFQIGVPELYITSILIVVGLGYLLWRRLYDDKLRYISLFQDYFPLVLIIAIALTGIWMRHFDPIDLVGVKEIAVGIFSFDPVIAETGSMFYAHFFLVSCLLIYFPFSKLVHLGGVFMSPTRNLPNNNRAERHINPWNDDFKLHYHTYMEYEDEFRDVMKAADLPLEKEDKDVN